MIAYFIGFLLILVGIAGIIKNSLLDIGQYAVALVIAVPLALAVFTGIFAFLILYG